MLYAEGYQRNLCIHVRNPSWSATHSKLTMLLVCPGPSIGSNHRCFVLLHFCHASWLVRALVHLALRLSAPAEALRLDRPCQDVVGVVVSLRTSGCADLDASNVAWGGSALDVPSLSCCGLSNSPCGFCVSWCTPVWPSVYPLGLSMYRIGSL